MKLLKLLFVLCFVIPKEAFSINTTAKQAILYDVQTDTIIFEKNADELMSPSSMSKLMTVYYIFKKISDGEISLKDTFKVSKKAWKKGGSKMFLNVNTNVTIEDLLRGIIVQSGNDACITIAEGFSGTESSFAEELNILAKEIGLTDSFFSNATGWPDPDHLMSARDILRLSLKTISDFPDLYKIYSEKEFSYNNIKQNNRNPLLFSDPFTDGLKTGRTSLGGFGLVASSIRKDRRVILVLNGLESNSQRKKESKRFMDIAFNNFKNLKILEKGKLIEKINVWNGSVNTIEVKSRQNLIINVPKSLKNHIKVSLKYTSPLIAPIQKDDQIAELLIKDKKGNLVKKVSLTSDVSIKEKKFLSKVFFKLKYLILGESIFSLKE